MIRGAIDDSGGVVNKTIGVVIPAYNEELLITDTLTAIPSFVDRIYVVDDASRDGTVGLAHTAAAADLRIVVIVQEKNAGVGAAVCTGYRRAIADRMDVICVMNADNQMDPTELGNLAGPVARGELDYAKANRLFTGQAWEMIPHYRYLGNAALSLLTKIASGYWHVADSQAGYTAISLSMLERINLDRLYKRYGYPNDMLVSLNIWNARVRDIPSRPIYGIGEKSGIRLRKVVPTISWLLWKRFWWRLLNKYVIRDFHPLVFFYVAGLFSWLLGFGIGVWQVVGRFQGDKITAGSVGLIALFMTFGVLFTLFAMWFDMETNKDLR